MKILKIIGFWLILTASSAQESSLDSITINATRVDKNTAEIPAAISVIGQDEIQLGSEQLSLGESLGRVPGLFLLNRYNFAQDLRASIRGFGARSSFGIRGIKIIVDGIPETLPDGQGSVDGIDIGSARQINVIRGPASSLYGNASGGAILIETERGPAIPFVEMRSTVGEFNFDKLQLKAGGEVDDLNYLLNLSDTSIDGFREHSEFENTQLNGRFEYKVSNASSLLASVHHTDQPIANDPGGITAQDSNDYPTQARQQNLTFDAGEALTQTRVGLLYKTELNQGRNLEARIYNTVRGFENRLPFESGGAVKLDRSFFGGGIKTIIDGHLSDKKNRLLLGFDYDRQDDNRRRFDNISGTVGRKVFDQNERVTATGIYLQNETRLSRTVEVIFGIRYDEVLFDVSDKFLSDGDDSGKITLDEVSPMLGVSIKHGQNTHLYATISSAFETPTTTEFADPGGGGFNQSLNPQQSTNYEIGIKKLTASYRFEAALFHIKVDNELTSFEQVAQPGRTFFENTGSSTRDGLELSYSRAVIEGVGFSAAYTYSDFTFDRFTNGNDDKFDGKRIPGIPEDLLHFGLTWFGRSGFYARWDTAYTGELFADNVNVTRVGSSTVSDIRFGHNGFYQDWEISTFVGANNLFDEYYYSNIRINAFGGRYFESAPEQNAFIGITIRKRFLR